MGPIHFFFLFRACILPMYILNDSLALALLCSLFHSAICLAHLKVKSPRKFTVAFAALIGIMAIELLDFIFNSNSITRHYGAEIGTDLLGISKKPIIFLLDLIGMSSPSFSLTHNFRMVAGRNPNVPATPRTSP
uniref:Serpentine receptor class gamma n=2 Tax=Caenorhabditis tropicalis TaxID=1561998 RepID=A0A1I7UIU4_9PELO